MNLVESKNKQLCSFSDNTPYSFVGKLLNLRVILLFWFIDKAEKFGVAQKLFVNRKI